MSHHQLLDVVQALTSNKKKDRLVCIERIQELLRQDTVVKSLHEAGKDSLLTWTVLFIRVHNAILVEVDRASLKNMNTVDKQLQAMQEISLSISHKSILNDVPLLECKTVISSILTAFETESRIKCLGSTYTELLIKYALGKRKYWGEIELDQWINLKNLCKASFINPPPNTPVVLYLDALSEIVRIGCKHAAISHIFLDLFSFVKNVFTSPKGPFCAYETSLLKLINILSLQLAVEFRYQVCSFVEDIFDHVIRCYEKKKSSKNPLIHHFLITYLNIHNPNGASKNDASFYACDEGKWKQQISAIYALTQETIRNKPKNFTKIDLEVGFLDLMVEINHVVFVNELDKLDCSTNIESEDYVDYQSSVSNKRKRSIDYSSSPGTGRSSGSRSKQIKLDRRLRDVLQDIQSSDTWFWLNFLEILLEKYPGVLSKEYRSLLELFCKLLYEGRDSATIQAVCRCLCVVLNKEKSCKIELTDSEIQSVTEIWNKIGVEIVRLLQIEEVDEYHALTRSLIVSSKLSNPGSMLSLYCQGTIRRNKESFLTLLSICQNCLLPESIPSLDKSNAEHSGNLRVYLVKWLFRERIRFPAKDLTKILIALISSRSEDAEVASKKSGETSKNIHNFCRLINASYEVVSLKNIKFRRSLKTIDSVMIAKIDSKPERALLECLKMRFHELNSELLEERGDSVADALHHCELLLNLHTQLEKLDSEAWRENLNSLKVLLLLSTKESQRLLEKNQFGLGPFIRIYSSNFRVEMNALIREKETVHLGFLQDLFRIFQERGAVSSRGRRDPKQDKERDALLDSPFSKLISQPRSILHVNILSEEELRVMEATELLCQFIGVQGNYEQNRYQKTLEMKLFDELCRERMDFNANFNVQLVLRIVYNFSQFDRIAPEVQNKCLDLLQSVFNAKKMDCEVAVLILEILKQYTGSDLCVETLINSYRTFLVDKNRCGVRTLVKYVELLGEVIGAESRGIREKVCEEMIQFLKHPYREVRLAAAQEIGRIFAVDEEPAGMINLVYDVLRNNAGGESFDNAPFVAPCYEIMDCAVSLITWANIICYSSPCRKSALFYMIELAYRKNYHQSTLQQCLHLICENLEIQEENKFIHSQLPYLIKKWISKRFNIELFPFYVTGCESISEFLTDNLKTILPVLLWNNFKASVVSLCEKLNRSFKEIVQDCCPELLAVVLPCMSENMYQKMAKSARKLRTVIENEISGNVAELTNRKFDLIVFNMFRSIEDEVYLRDLCQVRRGFFDDCGWIAFTVAQIVEAVENISERGSLQTPSAIQKVLLLLAGEIHKCCLLEDKVKALHRYVAFVDAVTKITVTESETTPFLIRDVLHTLRPFAEESQLIAQISLKCLMKLLRRYGNDHVISDFNVIVTPWFSQSNEEESEILNDFIRERSNSLESVSGIESLRQTIEQFLESDRKCGVERLTWLKNLLVNRKRELKEMYDNLNTLRGFSEDCSNSPLHRLICVLIELNSDESHLVRVEAAKCLGELGPSDLTTLVLKPENRHRKEIEFESPLTRLLKVCISNLTELIISDDFGLKATASDLLYAVFSSPDGNEIVEEMDAKTRAYLIPFRQNAQTGLQLRCSQSEFQQSVDDFSHWSPREHKEWVAGLVVQMLKSFEDSCGVIAGVVKMIRLNWQFAERIFPNVLDLVLSLGVENLTGIISRNVSAFFRKYASGALNQLSLQCMVSAVDYLRIQRNCEGFDQKFCLTVNYLHVAEAAWQCSAFFTAMLYIELWFDEEKKQKDGLTIDTVSELYPEEGVAATRILRDCYSKIGIYDGVHGCGYIHLLDFKTQVQHYEHLKKRRLSMLHHDIELSQDDTLSHLPLLHAFEASGMFFSLKSLIHSNCDQELSELQYRCAAYLGDWDALDSGFPDGYEKCRYLALKALHDGDDATFRAEIGKARKCTAAQLSSCSLESVQNLYELLSQLRCLKELEDFAAAVPDRERLQELHRNWTLQDQIKSSDFKFVDAVMNQRIALVRNELSKSEYLKKMLPEMYYKLAKISRKEREFEKAMRSLSYLEKAEVPVDMRGKVRMEKALLAWEIGETEVGKFLLCHCLKREEMTGALKAKALRVYGDWMATTNSENARHIIDSYYRKSIEEAEDKSDAYASLAKFADSNYEQIREYLNSPMFETKKSIINRQQDMVSELRMEIGWNQDREKKTAYHLVERQSAIDENEIRNSENEKEMFLDIAVRYYHLSLIEGEKYDLLVFRLVSLWFSNLENPNVTNRLKEYLQRIPSYKFLCLLPQIVPRIADVGLVCELIERTLLDHPHHTLPLLFALANSFEDARYCDSKPVTYTKRALTARRLLEKTEKDRKLRDHIREMHKFCDAMIEFANSGPEGNGKGVKMKSVRISTNLKIARLKNLKLVPVPSLSFPHRKDGNYDHVIGIEKFEDSYQLVGGINIPKKINCVGSDGVTRSLLVKGRDDLRQDAVMQQVFTIMNSLLLRNSETNRRKLVIRTYKVMPLSQRSGVIEWCENTQPLSLYLIGPNAKSGAHGRFNPSDITALECRARLQQTFAKPGVTNDVKLEAFLEICREFKPAFRYFFYENFPDPGAWFERRLAYTHSVATSSMIGYVLGIGDRHVHNILIDNSTAEVIHIDLGIAFEQGKTLRTPETVPFRLTRDIVDGMGISGVEGVFRRSCVKAMEVLRENRHTILTLLEVLLYDPLYAWTITAEKANFVQGHPSTQSSSEKASSDVEINKMAERALIRLKQKLQGIETGGIATNVEGQVNYLIQQARDPNNLSRLFHGWQAYL